MDNIEREGDEDEKCTVSLVIASKVKMKNPKWRETRLRRKEIMKNARNPSKYSNGSLNWR
jgi:hypothetical protein